MTPADATSTTGTPRRESSSAAWRGHEPAAAERDQDHHVPLARRRRDETLLVLVHRDDDHAAYLGHLEAKVLGKRHVARRGEHEDAIRRQHERRRAVELAGVEHVRRRRKGLGEVALDGTHHLAAALPRADGKVNVDARALPTEGRERRRDPDPKVREPRAPELLAEAIDRRLRDVSPAGELLGALP